jgi:hypothetical protein
MSYLYKIILLIFFTSSLYSQNIYNKSIRKEEPLILSVDNHISWVFKIPFDFQYKLYREGNFINFEGKNIGIEKIFVKASAIENRKQISVKDWEDSFLSCNIPYKEVFINDIEYALSPYRICSSGEMEQFKTYLFYNNTFYVLFIVWIKKNLNEEELKEIFRFIQNIQYKIKG